MSAHMSPSPDQQTAGVYAQPDGGVLLRSAAGLQLRLHAHGAMERFSVGAAGDALMLNLFPGNVMEGGPFNLYLRRAAAQGSWDSHPLLGPGSGSRLVFDEGASPDGSAQVHLLGCWEGLSYVLRLRLDGQAPTWLWQVELRHEGGEPVTLDLLLVQDLALAPIGAVRLNEYYVSQYVDHSALQHGAHGWVIATRQNQAVGGRFPWCLHGSLGHACSYATDALQLLGLERRFGAHGPGLREDLPARRLQHEHAMALLQEAPFELRSGQAAQRGFYGCFQPDHPDASGPDDLARVEPVCALAEAAPALLDVAEAKPGERPALSLFARAPLLQGQPIDEGSLRRLLPGEWRELERDAQGQLLSFFTGQAGHVVLPAKEGRVLRPHGHMLRSGAALVPDERALTSTVWMAGVFHSMLTQGHVSYNRLLSTTHAYLGLFRSHGLRIFVELDGVWTLLDQPSAFEMTPGGARWWYRHAQGLLEVRASASKDSHAMQLSWQVLQGPALRVLLSLHLALDGEDGSSASSVNWQRQGPLLRLAPAADSAMRQRFPEGGFTLRKLDGGDWERVQDDAALFEDAGSRQQPWLVLGSAAAMGGALEITADLVPADPALDPVVTGTRIEDADDFWPAMSAGLALQPPAGAAERGLRQWQEILPWFAHNALVHYLSPRGLEQYSGGGWGTRDVTQGPVEMMLALGRHAPVRDLLLRTFAAQNPDGDWPQWFMFFERERDIRAGDSHGDIVFWPLLALAQYLLASADADILDVALPFYAAPGQVAERATLLQHVQRALQLIEQRLVPGSQLVAYGHGDWNDSLQPADPAMREHLCSAWTVTLHYQTLSTLAQAFGRLGREHEASLWRAQAAAVREDCQRLLLPDGVLTGFADFRHEGRVEYLLHPRDARTGLRYSVLAMVHAIINEMLSPEQCEAHLALIGQHLLGPDGARLFDRAMAYHGGPMRLFQRAESASFFGREIGVMYTHAHLRYVECLWRAGKAQAFFDALCLVNPIGLRQRVPSSTLRQANCYYSSSDAAFADRYEAQQHYERIARGEVALEGGWRVYSSGPGIALSLLLRCLLGLRWEAQALVIDPVLPPALDGLVAELRLAGYRLELRYQLRGASSGPSRVQLNGADLAFTRESNRYRQGGAVIAQAQLQDALLPWPALNRFSVTLGEPG